MPLSGTGERVTPVPAFPSRDGLSVQAIRVDYEPGGFTRGSHRHPARAYVYVTDGSGEFVVGGGGRGARGAGWGARGRAGRRGRGGAGGPGGGRGGGGRRWGWLVGGGR